MGIEAAIPSACQFPQTPLGHTVLDLRELARHPLSEWVLGAAESWGIAEEMLQQVISLKEAGMIYAGVEELKDRAHREGRGEGRASLVCRQARLKFDAGTAEQLAELLKGVSDPERIARIGDRIILADTAAELLESARRP